MRASAPALPPKEKAFYLIVATLGGVAQPHREPRNPTERTAPASLSPAGGVDRDHSRPRMPLSGLSSTTEEL